MNVQNVLEAIQLLVYSGVSLEKKGWNLYKSSQTQKERIYSLIKFDSESREWKPSFDKNFVSLEEATKAFWDKICPKQKV